jgi:dTDP-4-dehydrorhamnose reductase/2-polyprenyl-3-methyl-5-hydroxy-6-metoxy-1,4-benzoquinol methylase
MAISIPEGLEVIFTRRRGDGFLYQSLDVTAEDLSARLDALSPDVIVNLAGENNPDNAHKNPLASYGVNVEAVRTLRDWCSVSGAHLVQVSSQAALDDTVNAYGMQKHLADSCLSDAPCSWTIVRPSFVLGIRPFPAIGRENPAERILSGAEVRSVNDRLFTACFAWDVVRVIWEAVQQQPKGSTWNVGGVDAVSRLDVARYLGFNPLAISHDELLVMGFCERPKDTTYTEFHGERTNAADGFMRLKQEYADRQNDTLAYRSKEIAAFSRIPHEQALAKLSNGFRELHPAVNADFRAANPQTDDELLAWYRNTPSYIWELTAYHSDVGFNYRGMVGGIIERLKQNGCKSVLCLGDGTGDLALACDAAGIAATYHDLRGSQTAMFAEFRMDLRGSKCKVNETSTFQPPVVDVVYDAIVSLDYLEHVPNVDEWAAFVYASLKQGGIFVAQNAFAIGSGPDGSIPMHLACNDRWEKDWDPMLFSLGFEQMGPQWYRRPSAVSAEWPAMVSA